MRDSFDSPLEFRRDVVAHVLSDHEIALLGEQSEHVLEGESLVAIAPFLDGTKTADEIVEAIADTVDPAEAYHALEQLQERGYVRPASARITRGWDAVSPELAQGLSLPGNYALKLKSYGLDLCAASLMEYRLAQPDVMPGCPVTILAVDDYLRPELSDAIATAQAEGQLLLPMRVAGPRVWFGPAVVPGQALDWPLFLKRHQGIRATDVTIMAAGGSFPLRPSETPAEIVQTAIGFAAQFAMRLSAGEAVDAICEKIWEMDMRDMKSQSHLLPRSDHPVGPQPTVDGHEPIILNACQKMFRKEGGHRICPPQDTLTRLMPHVDPICGVVPALIRGEAFDDLHHYTARQTQLGLGVRHSENRLLGRPQGAEGKGQTDTQAKVSCLGEAIERYSCCHTVDVQTRRARYVDMGGEAIHPDAVQQFSDAQFARRDDINRETGTFNSVPERFDPNVEISWTPLWSLTRNASRWLPTAMCYYNYDASEAGRGPRFASSNSNGCASGNTLEEAILQGMFELVERDAVAVWWYNRLHRPGVNLTAFEDAFFTQAQQLCSARGRSLQVIDLTNDLGIPVFVSVSARKGSNGFVCLGFGCHLDPRLAISRAITEMFQMLSRDAELSDVRSFSEDPEFIHWFEHVTLDTDTYLVADPAASVGPNSHVDRSTKDIAQDVQLCVDRLAARGLETLVLNHTRPDVGFPTARVVVPGLRHFWTRFAPGRLYDVPVAMGWRDAPLAENELNPIRFIW